MITLLVRCNDGTEYLKNIDADCALFAFAAMVANSFYITEIEILSYKLL